ncbi:hypothetical protein R1flu_027023 [Riccia fluitans]|uniref:Squalene cyclase C-terminal domain-containing protein n=1 Tax=Riccia fluitans TaxID=41844 RepID=A0ABD1XHL1_9MARC
MAALCDPSTPDLTEASVSRGVKYLRDAQEVQGSWFGRWGVNYLYGTSACLCGLAEIGFQESDLIVSRAVEWLKECQNDDGGWGEGLESYRDKSTMGKGIESSASQTAWAVMGLLGHLTPEDLAIRRGITWLVQNLRPSTEPVDAYEGGVRIPVNYKAGKTWREEQLTGTGFPNHFYIITSTVITFR